MPPTASNPVKISIVFGIVWAFLAAFIVSNIGKASGYGNPGVFVSLLSGLLTGAGIGTGSYYLFKNINTSVASSNAGGGQGSFAGDWDDAIKAGYLGNQEAQTEYQTATLLSNTIQGLRNDQQAFASFIPSSSNCVVGVTATQAQVCAASGFPIAGTAGTPRPCPTGTYSATGNDDGTATAGNGCTACTGTVSADRKTCTPASGAGGNPRPCPAGTYSATGNDDGSATAGTGCTACTGTVSADRKTCIPVQAPPGFAVGAQSCAAKNLTADQLLQCIFSGNAQSGAAITDYQLQQLASESGIPIDTLKTALQSANQTSLQAAWQAAGGPKAKYPVPPLSAAAAPAASAPGIKSNMSPGVAAAIALPLGALAIAVMLYGVTKLTPDAPGGITKGLFWGSLLTALMTTISAIGLGADTQINFKKLNSKQQDERRKATYALAAVALITAGITAALGIKYRGTGEGVNPLWNLSTVKPDFSEESAANLTGIMLITGSGVTGLGLAIDKGMNGKKRNPAEQRKRDIAMGVLLAISGVALLSGAAFKKQDAIKGLFANKYPTVTAALKASYEGNNVNVQKLRAVKDAIGALGNSAPQSLKNAQNLPAIESALAALSLKGRAAAAASAGLTTTAGLFMTGESYSKTRIGSAVLLLASIIILAVLKSQNKLKPAPKPGKPAPPPKVAPGEIVMYVMIGLSVLIFTGSLLKDKFFLSAPAAAPAPEAPEAPAPEAPEAPAPEPAAPVDLELAKQYAEIKKNFNNNKKEVAAQKVAGLPLGDPVKTALQGMQDGNITYTSVKNALNKAMEANPLPPDLG